MHGEEWGCSNVKRQQVVKGLMNGSLSSTGQERFLIGTAQQFRLLDWVIRALVVLNLVDALFTLVWVQTGLAVEANALMRDLVNHGALVFVLGKLALVSLGALFLWGRRGHALAVVAIFMTFLAYYLVLLHHLQFTSHLVIARFGL